MAKNDPNGLDRKTKKKLIDALLSNPKNSDRVAERGFMETLLKANGDPDFWLFVAKHHKFSSLNTLISQKGFIFKQGLEYGKQKNILFSLPSKVELQENKVGADVLISKKPTLFDFLA